MKFEKLIFKVYDLFDKFNYEIDLSKDLNIIIGENGDGKSSIINIINAIFNLDFISITKTKFKRIDIEFNEKKLSLSYNDLLAHPATYFGEFTFLEDEALKSIEIKMRNYRDFYFDEFNENGFEKNRNFNINSRIAEKHINFLNNFYENKIKPNNILESLVFDLIDKFGLDIFNNFVSLSINHEKNELLNIFNQLVLTTGSIYEYINNYFIRRRSESLNFEDFVDFVVEVNRAYKLRRNNFNCVQNSIFVLQSKLFNFLNDLTGQDSKNNFYYGRFSANVRKLNMVELYKIDTSYEKNYSDNYKSLNMRKTEEDNRDLNTETTTAINMSIKQIFNDNVFNEFVDKYLGLAVNIDESASSESVEKILSNIEEYDSLRNQIRMMYDFKLTRGIRESMFKKDRLGLKTNQVKDYSETFWSFHKLINDFIRSEYISFSRTNAKNLENIIFKMINLVNILEDLWDKRLGSIKDVETILNSYLTNKKVEITSSKRFLIKDSKTDQIIPLEFLSSGEKKILTLMTSVMLGEQDGIIFIDEPELSLSIPWQERLVEDLSKFVGKIVIATQSNHIARDKYSKNMIFMLNLE